jgi:adenylate kinase family enzyme
MALEKEISNGVEKPLGFMFIGRSGCGKGTQVELLKKYLQALGGEESVFCVYVGGQLRGFIQKESYTSSLARAIMKAGGRQPDFLANWALSDALVRKMRPNTHLIIDGSPRSLPEAKLIDEAMDFYGFRNVYPVFIDVSRDWAKERLLSRKREDDNLVQIEARLDYYEKDVAPAIEYYRNESRNKLVEINGEQPIEKVHQGIVSLLGL